MEDIFWEIFKKYGWTGIITAYLAWDKVIYPQWKKSSGNYLTREELAAQVERVSRHLSALEDKVSLHLEKKAQEDIVLGKMQVQQEFQSKEISENGADVKAIFGLISEIKNLIIAGKV